VNVEVLKARILAKGKNLGRGILKVDGFINHQVDPKLMLKVGEELAARFANVAATKVLTAEISGIAPAVMTALALDVPVVYARKTKPVTMTDPVYVEAAPSHTKGVDTFLMVSPEFLQPGDRILIIDDFLASGQTIHALVRLVHHAGAELVGIGTLIEKRFEGGRERLASLGVQIDALAVIASMENGQITFEGG
jgi:xanthine phosphoribosyltransferase